jgi:hypothetical protein
LPDHRECRERVSHAKYQTGPALPLDEINSIGKARRQWLIADHIHALVEKRDTGLIVGSVRRCDRDRVDSVRSCRLTRGHLLKIAVDAVSRQHPLGASRFGHDRVRGQCAGDYLPAVGEFGPVGMHPPDVAAAAADDAKSQPAPSGGKEGSRGHDGRPSTARVIASATINIVLLHSFVRKMSFASLMGSSTA